MCCYLGRSEAAVATTASMLIQASRFVNSFWLIFFGLSVVADLNLVPGLSGFLRAVAKRGKDDEGDDPAGKRRRPWWQVTVPHGWFTHFYVVGVLWNAVALFHSLIECAWAGSDPSVVGAALASTLFQAHVTRRLYESAFVSIHRPGGRMHVVGYLIGVVYYICVPLTLAHPLAAAAVVGSVADAWRRGSIAYLLEPVDGTKLAAAADGIAARPQVRVHRQREVRRGRADERLLRHGRRVRVGVGNAHQHRYHVALAELRGGEKKRENVEKKERAGAAKEYGVPRGGWFESVSCPHYAAEVLLYVGICAVACGSGFGAGGIATGAPGSGRRRRLARTAPMLASVAANLSLAARRNHEWYLRHMPDYPKGRWAMIPGIL